MSIQRYGELEELECR